MKHFVTVLFYTNSKGDSILKDTPQTYKSQETTFCLLLSPPLLLLDVLLLFLLLSIRNEKFTERPKESERFTKLTERVVTKKQMTK